MATTDARAGFRLPWSSDRQSSESADGESPEPHTSEAAASPTKDTAPTSEVQPVLEPSAAEPLVGVSSEPGATPPNPGPKPSGKKPSKFMADLTKAMQAAAEEARGRAISQLQADAKTQVETIHGRSSTEAASLRRRADDDVAAVREWSKAEIARVREETETKISNRKSRLESEIEAHAGVIEREIDSVQKTVAAFEEEMASFFERLLGEEDPSRFATMAGNLPEPPTFDSLLTGVDADAAGIDGEAGAADDDELAVGETEIPVDDTVATDIVPAGAGEGADGELDREAAFAAIQAAAEAASAEAVADAAEAAPDPRFAALGLAPDFDAAEVEAFANAGPADGEDIPEIHDGELAARLAGLVPAKRATETAAAATQVVVVGLVSVASIASFKRHLGRLPGVLSVGVSSGPEGEFVFAVSHGADVVLREAVPSLPTFQARVTDATEGIVHVTAHDPESDA
jgi:hypothetical protein